jgi:hypothetical protein
MLGDVHNRTEQKVRRSLPVTTRARTAKCGMTINHKRGRGRHPYSGSTNGVGVRFQSFRINDLEMVAQICPRWNRVADWLKEAERFSTAA